MSKSSFLGRVVYWLLMGGATFIALVGFLGFIGWFPDPSNQKWWALGGSLLGVAGIYAFRRLEE